jgi:hypothetical protein
MQATNPIWIAEIRARVATSVNSMHNKITCSLPNNLARCKHAPGKPEANNKNMSNRRGTLKARKHTVVRVTLHTDQRHNAWPGIHWSVWQDPRHCKKGREVSVVRMHTSPTHWGQMHQMKCMLGRTHGRPGHRRRSLWRGTDTKAEQSGLSVSPAPTAWTISSARGCHNHR